MPLIYCVEDDEGISELILCALKSGGYDAVAFDTPQKFFERMKKQIPSLVLLDIMLPGEDGISVLKKIRSDVQYKNIPVIMLTAKSSEVDKVVGLESGADDFITKPFGIMELLSRIKAVLRRTGQSEQQVEPVLRYEGLEVNCLKRQVTFNDKPVELTFKEFELLAFLLKNVGIVLSRDKIVEKVWGYDFEGESRTVDMHIKTLRQKLEEAGCVDYIKTVRGVGYKI